MTIFKRILKEWVLPFGLEILIILLIIKYVFFLAMVPTGSMIPTIDEKSWLFVTRIHNPEKSVERGDIVVFESDELNQTLIKRVVGMPGDEIEIDEVGRVYINGRYYQEDYVVFPSDQSGEWKVPEGRYFFLGDNRGGSYDARYWEEPYIPAEKLTGEARFILWPPKDFGVLN